MYSHCSHLICTADEGEWVNGKYNGKGIFRWNDGRHYSGEWKDSLQHGFGTEYRADGSTRHRGQWFEQRPVDDHGLSLDDSVDNLFYNHDESAQQHSAQQSQQSSSMEVASADHSENQTGINDARAVPAPPQGAPMHTLNPGRKPPPVYRTENKNPVGPSMNPPPLRARTSSGSSASSMPGRQIRSVVPPAHQSNRQLQVSEDSNRAASMPLSSPIRPYSSEGRAPMPGRGRVGARGGRGMPRQFPSSSSVGSTRSLQTAPPVLTQQAGAGTSMRSLRPSLVQQSMRGGSTRSGMSASVASSRSLMSNFTSATGTAGSVRSLATIQSAGSQSSGMNSHETEAATINTNGIVDSKPQTANRNPSVHEQAIPKSPRTMTMTGSVVSSPTNSPKSSSRARPNTSRMNSTSSSLAPPLRTQSTAPRVAVPRKAGSVEAAGPPPTAMMRSQSARPTMMQHQYTSARMVNNHNTAFMVPSLHGDGGMVDPRQQQTLGNSNRHHRDRSADSPKFSPMRSTRQMFSRTLSRLSPRSSRNVVSSSMNRDTDTMSVPEATSQRSKKGLFSKMSKRFGGKKQRQQRQQQQQQQQQQQGDPQSHLPPSQSEVQPVQTSSREDLLQNVLPPQLQSEFDE